MINILIVDDRPENLHVLEDLLEREDINLITTTLPHEALKLCVENDISIALIDVHMPQMDGFELVEILKSDPRTQEILIIFITGLSMDTRHVVRGLATGAIDYLFKPLDLYITTAKVDSLIALVKSQREIKRKNIELENYQDELIRAKEQAEEGKRTKENFLANMSHEIRTPINGIMGLAHLLKQSGLNDEQFEMVKLLEFSSQSLLGVVNDVLDNAKIDAGKFTIVRSETNIVNLVQSIIDLMRFRADEKGIILKSDIGADVPAMIMADSLRLNQILMNLVSNAIKFTKKGNVTVSLKLTEKKGNMVNLDFSVSDTGIGIPKDSIKRIFNRFEQAGDDTAQKFGGTGLGLSIVKKLARLKGGHLSVKSEEGKGSVFSFCNWYPKIESEKIPKQSKSVLELPKFSGLSVLVAEDNPINQFMIVQILKGWDINVDTVDDGLKVLDSVKNKDYDLILMDTYMPNLNGHETTRRIRTEMSGLKKDVPIISFSAGVMDEEQQAARDAGVNDIISKPFEPSVLHYKIGKLVDKLVV